MINEEKEVNHLKDIELSVVDEVCDRLRIYSRYTGSYLANIIAALCDVDKDEMLSDTKHLYNSHARWFYWFAYRYMTNESYDSIAKRCENYRKFTESCVGICVAKMSMMVEQEPMWKKRWVITKRIIKSILDDGDDQPSKLTLKVIPPKGVTVEILKSKK